MSFLRRQISDFQTRTGSILFWIRPNLGRILLLGIVIYASIIVYWSANWITLRKNTILNRKFNHFSLQQLAAISAHRPKTTIKTQLENPNITLRNPKLRNLTCLGWQKTQECRPDGHLVDPFDSNCSHTIVQGSSGYCQVQDVDTKETFQVMRTHCNSVRRQFNCKFAPYFMNFRLGAEILIEKALTSNLVLPNVNITATTSRDGIVIIVYPKLLASAYASLRVLRHVLHCDLPIAIFYRPDELTAQDQRFKPIQDFAAKNQKITFQEIHDPHAKRFLAKIYAIYHTTFDRVLFLDADNVPVRDPSFLFESREFLDTGAMFWPDFWYPGHSMFGLSTHSLVWELLDLPFVDMFEQESGQVLIDRRRHALPLELVRYYGFHRPNFFTSLKLAWGDKDLFRFAWLKLNVPFTMIQTPPAMAGVIVEKSRATRDFCGMTMVQHDANGEILFVHRNRVKLTGTFADQNHIDTMHDDLVGDHSIHATSAALDTVVKYPDPTIWTHVARFRMESDRKHYTIKSFMANLSFKSRQKCYGLRDVDQNPHFYIQDIAALNLSGLESHLQQYALESVEYLSKNVSKG